MITRKRFYPFNAEQTVNILSEFGPLVTMFVVNAAAGINWGTRALIVTTIFAIILMRIVLKRLPVFPLIASSVTIVFGLLTLLTGDPMWVQIKVTIFNAMFAAFLFLGLWLDKNFFQYVFQKTFFYTKEGWDRFTWSFAWFFVFTAVLNEVVRLSFKDTQLYSVLGFEMNGVNVWILFKIALIMPLSGVYAWFLTRLMQKYRVPADHAHAAQSPARRPLHAKGHVEFAAIPVERAGLPKTPPGRSADMHRP
jgi:intracellular septation protein